MGYIESGKNDGAKVVTGGTQLGNSGYFVQATIFTDVKPDMKIVQEEIFGPVITAYVYDDAKIDETLDLINSTSQYALTGAMYASFFCRHTLH